MAYESYQGWGEGRIWFGVGRTGVPPCPVGWTKEDAREGAGQGVLVDSCEGPGEVPGKRLV